jgi:hypothetical protein
MQVISQEMLAKYRRLQDRETQARERRNKLRGKLIYLQSHGAHVQPGTFALRISNLDRVSLSWPAVEQVLDAEMCDWLREQIPPIKIKYVRVTG